MMKPKLLLTSSILCSIFYLVLFNPLPLIGYDGPIKADVLMPLQKTVKGSPNAKLIAWAYGGDIFIINDNLKVIDKISVLDIPIRQIIQLADSLFILADRNKNDGTIESVISQYDLLGGHKISTWSDPNHYIWSLSANVRMLTAVTSDGDLLELGESNLKPMAKYPERSYYIHTKEDGPIICAAPDLSKLHWKPSYCYREGKYRWRKDGQWRDIAPPFLCDNYLVEENLAADEKIISIINIATGKEVNRKTVKNLSALGCAEHGIIYASGPTLIICDVPDFSHMKKIVTNCKHISSAVKIGDTVYYIGEKRALYRRKLN